MATFLVSIAFLALLTVGTLLVLKRTKIASRQTLLLFFFALVVHTVAALVIFYTQFYPFGGGRGDSPIYHDTALAIAQDFREGNFSFSDLQAHAKKTGAYHLYPALLGAVYAFTIGEELVGVMLSVWFAALAVILVYLIAKELGSSPGLAMGAGIAAALYPSLLYFGSLVLRESLVAFLALLSLWLTLRFLRRFSWKTFFALYGVLVLLIHFRFYIGFVALLVFLISFIFLLRMQWKRKLACALIIVPLLGFLPQLSGHGYYGFSTAAHFLRPNVIRLYREVAYAPSISQIQPQPQQPQPEIPSELQQPQLIEPEGSSEPEQPPAQSQKQPRGRGSTVVVQAGTENPLSFLFNSVRSFLIVSLGPFPWQFQYPRHWLTLGETMWWYALFFFIAKGVFANRKHWRTILPVLFFGIGFLGLLSLFIVSNFGVYMRIRIPAFLALLALLPFGLEMLTKVKIWHTKI